jgi:ribose 5-phosphate isomerase RpiB
MRVVVGSDHAGFDLKEIIRAELAALGHDVTDHGTSESATSVDFPDFGAAARVTGATLVADALAAFRAASEEHGRHDLRIEKLAALDRKLAGHRSLGGIS